MSDVIQDVQEQLFILSINLYEFDGRQGQVVKHMSLEEERNVRAIVLHHRLCLCSRAKHGRELEHIAREDDLFTSEWQATFRDDAQCTVYGINNVTSNHGDLVDDDGVTCAYRFHFLFGEVFAVVFRPLNIQV